MKWKTFLQIMLLLIIARVLFEIDIDKKELYEKPRCQDASLKLSRDIDKSRYQYTGREKSYSRVEFTDPNTNKSIYKYVPIERWGVFDTWEGKLYTIDDLNNEIVVEEDIVNRKIKIYPLPKEANDFQADIDLDKMQEEIEIRLEREQQKQKEDLLKSLLQSKN